MAGFHLGSRSSGTIACLNRNSVGAPKLTPIIWPAHPPAILSRSSSRVISRVDCSCGEAITATNARVPATSTERFIPDLLILSKFQFRDRAGRRLLEFQIAPVSVSGVGRRYEQHPLKQPHHGLLAREFVKRHDDRLPLPVVPRSARDEFPQDGLVSAHPLQPPRAVRVGRHLECELGVFR